MAVTEPEPADVPVNITEQLVTPDTVERVQVGELREPPVLPAVSVKVTVPVGTFEAVVGSATVTVTDAAQVVPPRAIFQFTFGTVVEGLSFTVNGTITTGAGPLLPFCVESAPWVVG